MYTHPVFEELKNEAHILWLRGLAGEQRPAHGPTLWDRLRAAAHAFRLPDRRLATPGVTQPPAREPRIVLAPGVHLEPPDVRQG